MDVVLAVTGASGAIYAKRFIDKVSVIEGVNLHILMSGTAVDVWRHELGTALPPSEDNGTFFHPWCSGSSAADAMVVLPCSMGTLGRIAAGTADDAIARCADVQLKERKKLILVAREAPYSLIHLRNMTRLTESGAVIFPASPAFYAKPSTIEELVDSLITRVISMAGITEMENRFKWLNNK